MGDCDGDCQLGFGWWVSTVVGFYLLVEGRPVGGVALVDVRGAGESSQMEGRGNGCQRLLNALRANLICSSCVSSSYPMGKGLDEGKALSGGALWEVGVGVAEVGVEEVVPVTPELGSGLASRSHDPMGCCCCRSSEKTKEVILVVRWCTCQEAACERGNLALNLVRNSESDSL